MFWNKWKRKNPESLSYKWEMAHRISGYHVKYVTEKKEDIEMVIGKDGAINIKEEDLLVFASMDVLFRCPVKDLQAWILLSGDGVVLTGPDLEHGGQVRTVTVYYVYHIK